MGVDDGVGYKVAGLEVDVKNGVRYCKLQDSGGGGFSEDL